MVFVIHDLFIFYNRSLKEPNDIFAKAMAELNNNNNYYYHYIIAKTLFKIFLIILGLFAVIVIVEMSL